MGWALVTKLLDRKVDHIRDSTNRKWHLLFLNNQIRFSNISVSTIQTADDLNYFGESNLFVSKFRISGTN